MFWITNSSNLINRLACIVLDCQLNRIAIAHRIGLIIAHCFGLLLIELAFLPGDHGGLEARAAFLVLIKAPGLPWLAGEAMTS